MRVQASRAFWRILFSSPFSVPEGRSTSTKLTAFDAESFGGPDNFCRTMGGFAHLIDVHRGLQISETQRQRFVELYLAAADTAALPADGPFRASLR